MLHWASSNATFSFKELTWDLGDSGTGSRNEMMRRDFSLVELLVAMVILSLIVLVSTQSFALFTQRWDGRLEHFDDRFDELRARWVVRDLLTSIHPFVVKNPAGRDRFYFEGNRNGFVAVASQSVFDNRIPAVVRLSFVIAKDGKYDLTYEEWPMVTDQLRSTTQTIPWSAPILLARDVTAPDFAYFGIPKNGGATRNGSNEPGGLRTTTASKRFITRSLFNWLGKRKRALCRGQYRLFNRHQVRSTRWLKEVWLNDVCARTRSGAAASATC